MLDYKELCNTLAEAAKEYGAKIYENCDVNKVMVGEGNFCI
jgi:phytoene dehydrogenase-like protein